MDLAPLSLLLALLWRGYVDGYDAYYTCSKPFRSAKAKPYYPCDLSSQTWCTLPGSYYPWRAVRRFVYENHGLMRRMYGDERHISVLRSEIDSNDIDYQPNSQGEEWGPKQYVVRQREDSGEVAETEPPLMTTTETVETTETTEASTEATTEATTPSPSPPSSPPLFQDTVDKTSTTEKPQEQMLFKSKGVNACPVKEEVVAPFWANNTRGEVLALLNLYPFEQYVHWERCTFENKQMFCRTGCRCEQQYRLHRLLAYDPSNDCRGIFSDWFKFPSCCVCRCYDLPSELRITSRSPRSSNSTLV